MCRLTLISLFSLCAGMCWSAQTSTWAVFQNTVSTNWTDAGNWHNENGTATGELPLTGEHNVNIPVGTTCSLTNELSRFYKFTVAGTAMVGKKTGTAYFEIGDGGKVVSSASSIGESVGATGIVSVASNGYWNAGGTSIGVSGVGIATNAGSWGANGNITIGVNSNSFGRFVFAPGGKSVSVNNQRAIIIGKFGCGELVVAENATFSWPIYKYNGAVILGSGPCDNRIAIESNGVFLATRLYVGGINAAADGNPRTPGRGEVRLRGGSLAYDIAANDEWTIHLGTFTGESGIDTNSYGAIRGWGKLTGNGARTGDWSAHYLIGYGEICADGEGDESHELNCTSGMTAISNALPSTVMTTSGWRAVNRGIAYPRGSAQLGNTELKLQRTANVGCSTVVEKPDLINSIRVTARGLTTMTDQRYFGAAICAGDRTDAHTNSLPAFVSVLGVIKVGVFDNRGTFTYARRSSVSQAEVMIRYDQTKIMRNDTRLQVWHYVEADGRWTKVAGLKAGERPADCCLTTATVGGNLKETFNLGTFAVIEREDRGLAIILR